MRIVPDYKEFGGGTHRLVLFGSAGMPSIVRVCRLVFFLYA